VPQVPSRLQQPELPDETGGVGEQDQREASEPDQGDEGQIASGEAQAPQEGAPLVGTEDPGIQRHPLGVVHRACQERHGLPFQPLVAAPDASAASYSPHPVGGPVRAQIGGEAWNEAGRCHSPVANAVG
jgi:hypothetical protein